MYGTSCTRKEKCNLKIAIKKTSKQRYTQVSFYLNYYLLRFFIQLVQNHFFVLSLNMSIWLQINYYQIWV